MVLTDIVKITFEKVIYRFSLFKMINKMTGGHNAAWHARSFIYNVRHMMINYQSQVNNIPPCHHIISYLLTTSDQ